MNDVVSFLWPEKLFNTYNVCVPLHIVRVYFSGVVQVQVLMFDVAVCLPSSSLLFLFFFDDDDVKDIYVRIAPQVW